MAEFEMLVPSGSEDVECDSCTRKKSKAVKSCLVCLASFCETHLQCICLLCMLQNHNGHYIMPAAAERIETQTQLLEIQRKFQEQIQNKEKDLCELINAVESHKCSAQTAVENIERICTELITSINRRCSELKDMIRDRETAEVSQAEKVLKQVEQQIVELKWKYAELEKLSHRENPGHFFQSLLAPAGSAESATITISPFLSFDDVTKSVSQLRKKVEEFWKEQCEKIPVKKVRIISPPNPEIKEDFLHYFCRFTLGPNTVNKYLRLSEENKVVTWSGPTQSYPDHPDRFDLSCYQVLCRESVSGRCYWEVEVSTDKWVYIAVSYKSISRKGYGNECEFGKNDQSWSLFCSPSSFSFWHNNKDTEILITPNSFRIGVYVDYEAGTLSFYSVSDTMKLLHRVQTTFTQLLYPGFSLYSGSVKLSD